jgi:hypothetical protein
LHFVFFDDMTTPYAWQGRLLQPVASAPAAPSSEEMRKQHELAQRREAEMEPIRAYFASALPPNVHPRTCIIYPATPLAPLDNVFPLVTAIPTCKKIILDPAVQLKDLAAILGCPAEDVTWIPYPQPGKEAIHLAWSRNDKLPVNFAAHTRFTYSGPGKMHGDVMEISASIVMPSLSACYLPAMPIVASTHSSHHPPLPPSTSRMW